MITKSSVPLRLCLHFIILESLSLSPDQRPTPLLRHGFPKITLATVSVSFLQSPPLLSSTVSFSVFQETITVLRHGFLPLFSRNRLLPSTVPTFSVSELPLLPSVSFLSFSFRNTHFFRHGFLLYYFRVPLFQIRFLLSVSEAAASSITASFSCFLQNRPDMSCIADSSFASTLGASVTVLCCLYLASCVTYGSLSCGSLLRLSLWSLCCREPLLGSCWGQNFPFRPAGTGRFICYCCAFCQTGIQQSTFSSPFYLWSFLFWLTCPFHGFLVARISWMQQTERETD